VTRPDSEIDAPDVAAIESVIRRAIDERRPDLIPAIGNGEFSIAMRWDAGQAPCVVKRVPPFLTRTAANQYVDLVKEHLDDLRAVGVKCVTTNLHVLDRSDGSAVVFHAQPLLDMERLADSILQKSDPSDDHPILTTIVDTIVRVVGGGMPLDAQFANWYWYDNEAWQLDFSTPLMLTDRGDLRFDPKGFEREYPAITRGLVYRELMKIAPRYTEVDFVLTDTIVQLYRQGLDAWDVPFVNAAQRRHGLTLSRAVARQRYEADAKFYPTLLRLKRFQRAWIQGTRRRYDTLLPAVTSFGK
jgi:hypothetical protein